MNFIEGEEYIVQSRPNKTICEGALMVYRRSVFVVKRKGRYCHPDCNLDVLCFSKSDIEPTGIVLTPIMEPVTGDPRIEGTL